MDSDKPVKHRRRYCREPGCTKIVKSQGLCQRHGAKTKMCKIEGCPKQAQGSFDGMCKSHFNLQHYLKSPDVEFLNSSMYLTSDSDLVGSVYNRIIPASIAWKVSSNTQMPLVQHLRFGYESFEAPGWHRNNERLARDLSPIVHVDTPFEQWEQELVQIEALILNGNDGNSAFLYLARGWGREEGFHAMLVGRYIIEKCGEVKRSRIQFLNGGDGKDDDDDHEHADSFLDVFDDNVGGKDDDSDFDFPYPDNDLFQNDSPFST